MGNLSETIISGVTILISIATIIVTMRIDKWRLATKIITENRIEWIKQVRSMLGDFACEYVKGERKDNHKLWELKTRVELFMRRDAADYCKLLKQMELCYIQEYSFDNYEMFMYCSTYVLNRAWKRIVIEGKGMVMRSDPHIAKLVNESTKSLLGQILEKEKNMLSEE